MKTKKIVLASLLIALSFIIPLLPLPKFVLGPYSATLASHVPLMIGMFISPWVVVGAAIGSAGAFLMALGPVVALRALSHVLFGLVGAVMLKKKMNLFLVCAVTMVLHAAGELVVAMLFGSAFMAIFTTVGLLTMVHHVIDFVISLVVIKALTRANMLERI